MACQKSQSQLGTEVTTEPWSPDSQSLVEDHGRSLLAVGSCEKSWQNEGKDGG